MTTTLRPRRTRQTAAVVALDGRHAQVARFEGTSGPVVADIDRGTDGNDRYLLRVIHEVGDAETVSVVGSDPARLAFERKFVAIDGRPERLRDANPNG
jgi:hypothetical protein